MDPVKPVTPAISPPGDCCGPGTEAPPPGPFRRALIAVLVINASMFVIEMAAGVWGKSVALQADALDFLGDSATYAITLLVLGMSLRWRAAAAAVKGASMCGFGLWVVAMMLYHLMRGSVPDFAVMGSVGAAALAANLTSAVILYRYRTGDSNMRSVWLCTRNDAIANIAVIAAASGVWASASAWPDLGVGAVIAALALGSGVSVLKQVRAEMKSQAA